MGAFSGPVQQAIFDRLNGLVPGVPTFTAVPDKTQPPCIVIAESTVEDIGSKTRSAELHSVVVRSFFVGTSKRPMLAAAAAIKGQLDRQALPVQPGVQLSSCNFIVGAERRDVEEAVLIYEQTFQVIAQAA